MRYKSWNENGYRRFAIEVLETDSVDGFIGLAVTRIGAHFSPAVEIGWRLSISSDAGIPIEVA